MKAAVPDRSGMRFRLSAPSQDFYVELRLRSTAHRWIAVADIAGEHGIGIGRNPREALVASLASLGADVRAELLADLRLWDVSRRLRGSTAS
jgi:hypothetical protein